MKEISEREIEQSVYQLFLQANYVISPDIRAAMERFRAEEPFPVAKQALGNILENYNIASSERMAICQDCGMALVFAEIGNDIHINGDFEAAINRAVAAAYQDGYLRKSVVGEPLFDRRNTGDNTPAIVHLRMTTGDQLKLTVVAKGFGSENTSRVKIFIPSNTLDDIRDFIVETIRLAGPSACPPVIVGVGIGGTLEKAAIMAKHATIREIGQHHPDPRYAALENAWLDAINATGIGPAGLGGKTTAIALNIETYPTHIASVPVVVNLCCQASRHAEMVL